MSDPSAAVVLYVEDEVLIQQIVEAGLREAGFDVVLASNAKEGLDILAARQHEILGLITDINLGDGLGGWAVARHVRELTPGLPVVYVSGKDGHEWASHGVPCSVLITKPFAPAQIVVAISSLLNTTDPQV